MCVSVTEVGVFSGFSPSSDTTIPVITLLTPGTQTIEVGTNYSELVATATDDTDGDIVIDATNVNTAVVASYSVTYNISDAAGNPPVQETRTVNVVATTIPKTITQANIQTAINAWVSNPTTAEATYGHIQYWDVSSVTDMSNLFAQKDTFNEDISSWDVPNVTDMRYMFFEAEAFNQDIGAWNVSNVADMKYMFFE